MEDIKIHLISPGKHSGETVINNGVELFRKKNISVEVGENASGHFGYFSGTDEMRTSDFLSALEQKNADVFFSRGGYGAIKVLELLPQNILTQQTPFIYGYSDATVFHLKMTQLGLPSAHCPMALDFPKLTTDAIESLINAIHKKPIQYEVKGHEFNIPGNSNAIITGGNLAVICSLLGSNHLPDFKGKILFLEEVGEALYAIDRMMMMLELNGILKNLSGLIVGQFTSVGDSDPSYESTYEKIIFSYVSKYEYPVGFNFPSGHVDFNKSFYMGTKADINIQKNQIKFNQNL